MEGWKDGRMEGVVVVYFNIQIETQDISCPDLQVGD